MRWGAECGGGRMRVGSRDRGVQNACGGQNEVEQNGGAE